MICPLLFTACDAEQNLTEDKIKAQKELESLLPGVVPSQHGLQYDLFPLKS
jgi:hypothetical protein